MRTLIIFVLAITVSLTGFSQKKGKAKIPKDLKGLLKNFEAAVKFNHQEGIIECIDADYFHDQHDDFLEGQTEQFLSEFFCGMDIKTKEYKCQGPEKIVNMYCLEIEPYEYEEGYVVKYEITLKNGAVLERDWLALKQANGKTYGLVGSSG